MPNLLLPIRYRGRRHHHLKGSSETLYKSLVLDEVTSPNKRKPLKDQQADGHKQKVILEIGQHGKPIEWLPIIRLNPPVFGLLACIHCMRHEGREELRPIMLPDVILKIPGSSPFLGCWLAKTVSDRLFIVLIRNVSLTGCSTDKEELPASPVSVGAFYIICTNPNA
ncbi:hypothetical protein Cgig2_033986 [Carnegiea gigantea]|uniref:Uncharacterized protein n=1 Tax=Carnegiea gigantea TaxID=171969 RepID=A0A9Q1Q729_9CARY|nr:hypothetical protein Cgig2_033986 [Carnegiea gigantea]